MPKETANHKLKKPLYSDNADIAVINENFDAIDELLTPSVYAANAPDSAAVKGKLSAVLGWLANRIKAITGLNSWQASPPVSLTECSNHISNGTHQNATINSNGFMSYSDKQKLDNATSDYTASKLMMRDSSGRARVQSPSNSYDIANKNYNDICNLLKLDSNNIVRPYQTHTNNVKKISGEVGIFPQELKDIDGLITQENNKILSLTFADCTPIYLYDKQKNIIGNIHSGWQGTIKKIAKHAIIQMKKEFNSNPKDIVCVIGPTIRKCHFEVQEDVKNKFYNAFNYMKNIDKIIEFNKNTNSYFIDTVEINKELLKEEGILEENIVDSGICTYCNSNIIHSYRKEGKQAGRNTALICLK